MCGWVKCFWKTVRESQINRWFKKKQNVVYYNSHTIRRDEGMRGGVRVDPTWTTSASEEWWQPAGRSLVTAEWLQTLQSRGNTGGPIWFLIYLSLVSVVWKNDCRLVRTFTDRFILLERLPEFQAASRGNMTTFFSFFTQQSQWLGCCLMSVRLKACFWYFFFQRLSFRG